ncbi:GntR family transcriptional regulator [Streptomyces platensis]|uniref:GntR family transcriptional regulator n=1 Tax=Streptomyces platensis TaxID=58346 RepID=UPI001F397833|nr:GntR family transcriptional regulator [Streptomyces platensis]MCF3143755.1 GntR family transcriptional regulator [Streptomyces platensis]
MKPTPVYQQIADDLRNRILGGSLRPGDQLPTEAALMEQYEVKARATVREGLKVLVNEGLVAPQRPRGYFVVERKRLVYRPQAEFRRRPPETDIFTNLVADDGRTPSQDIEVSIVEAPTAVRERLGLPEGASVAVRRRLRRLDGVPYNVNDSYVDLDLVQGTEWMHPTDVPRGTNAVLGELLEAQLDEALDEIYIRMPLPNEARRLEIGPGVPVGEHIATMFSGDKPVQVTVNIVPGDRHVIVYERTRPSDADSRPRIPWGAQ